MFKMFSDAVNVIAMAVAVVVIAFSVPLQSNDGFSDKVSRARTSA